MQISAWLTHPEIPCFNFSSAHVDLLEGSIEGAKNTRIRVFLTVPDPIG